MLPSYQCYLPQTILYSISQTWELPTVIQRLVCIHVQGSAVGNSSKKSTVKKEKGRKLI